MGSSVVPYALSPPTACSLSNKTTTRPPRFAKCWGERILAGTRCPVLGPATVLPGSRADTCGYQVACGLAFDTPESKDQPV